ncbi:MAG TPA: PilZ domain-containing protein [Candidatus Hydrogenedentes bacterium]|nr:PilZ domain-containing protein [Candidatus Hydrogenedentota bacterium]HIJ72880.1 PilZ domain-containing protein [Candidatus Hydrogenedentota bacterium]
MLQGGEERRRYPRSRRRLPVVSDAGGPGVLNHVDNISANGVLCHTVKPIPLMTKLSIALEIPKPVNRRIECEGIVVRCDPHEQGDDHFKVAILYTKMTEEDHQAIKEFVELDLAEADATDTEM